MRIGKRRTRTPVACHTALAMAEGAEPPHIHVEQGGCTAKFWLDPVQLAGSRGFRSRDLNRLRALVIEHRIRFQEAWHGHFGA